MDPETRKTSVLVIGFGSIGRRHLRNLKSLGIHHLAACDCDLARLEPLEKELGVRSYTDFQKALEEVRPDLVFVCTPPVFHVPQALQAVRAGAHVFVEKPLSNSCEGLDVLESETRNRSRVVQVGYNLRFHPGLQIVKQLVGEGAIGRVLWADVEVGQYLPDWRPWQDYRLSYTARSDLGGGIILDASHELDYLLWLLGSPSMVACMAGRVSDLQVDVEDCATVLLSFPNGSQACVHMDFVQRGYARSCKLAGQDGTIFWDDTSHEVRLWEGDAKQWKVIPYTFASNDMYMEEVRDFLRCTVSGANPVVDLAQARSVLRVALAAKTAAGRPGVRFD